ncbi:MAG TPA: hypothetical protein EYQ73_03595 [Candidatus Poseidoniales archaeon]|nr:hypothetical protein [Candidatus Poseidoniales archaeon]
MAWPFASNDRLREGEMDLSEERLKMMANVAIEQVPMPEEGTLSEEDAWTISPGPTRAKLNSIGSIPGVGAAAVAAAPTTVNTTFDSSGLERLISSRLDMVEDVLRKVETHMTEVPQSGGSGSEANAETGEGDSIVAATGEVISGTGTNRMMEQDAAPLLELYEAQALASNPFLVAPSHFGEGGDASVGAPTIAALLLDHLSGMAAVSFAQKAIDSGMLDADEGQNVLSIVRMAAPGAAENALEDHLPNRELLTFSALVSNWRKSRSLRGEI